MKQARWADRALTDFIRIADHYASTAPHFPPILLDRIDRLVMLLLAFPQIAPTIGGTSFRKARVTGTDFILFYRPVEDGIEIARIFHSRENWRPL